MRSAYSRLDFDDLLAEYPIGDDFSDWLNTTSRHELEDLKERRFVRLVEHAWTVPFYGDRWAASGLEPSDIRSLADIEKLPVIDKHDIVQHYEENPFSGRSQRPGVDPLVVHTTSGTTGTPQPLVFSPRTREISNAFVARLYLWHGLAATDVVHSVYGHGMINGGHHIREAVVHFTDSLFLSAGSGNETPSIRQIDLMRQFGSTVLVGFSDYIKRLAHVAVECGSTPGDDLGIRLIFGHLGTEGPAPLEAVWPGATAFDWYGVGDTGMIAGAGPERDGLHVWEDAHHVEILDSHTGRPVADGEVGDVVCTSLYKIDTFPIIRFNTHDVSRFLPLDDGPAGNPLRRIAGFLGRSDNMVKLRGINVYPHAIASLLPALPQLNGEYVCIVDRRGDRDELTVRAEVALPDAPTDGELRDRLAELMRQELSVSADIELVEAGATAHLTEIDRRQKPIRLVDRRTSTSAAP